MSPTPTLQETGPTVLCPIREDEIKLKKCVETRGRINNKSVGVKVLIIAITISSNVMGASAALYSTNHYAQL